MTCPYLEQPDNQNPMPPCHATWRELARLQAEVSRLTETLAQKDAVIDSLRERVRYYGEACLHVGLELRNL